MSASRLPIFASTRRHFLRAAGITLALPLLESLGGRVFAQGSAISTLPGKGVGATRPKRMVCVGNMLGFHPPAFFPTTAGTGYDLPTDLEFLRPHQKDLSIFSGLDHGVKGGHFAISSFLSGVRTADAKGMPEGNLTLDQRAAETMGGATRFPSLALGSESGIHGGCLMSWTRSGTRVPPISTPRELFRKLFVSESAARLSASVDRLDLKGSILDAVQGDAKSLERQLGQRDKEKLDEYFTSVRDVEKQIELRRQWAHVPKPDPKMKEPENKSFVSDLPVMYDLIALALQTDSTRIATFEIGGDFEASAFGLNGGYHAFSHHGQRPEAIAALIKMERYQVEQFARFLARLGSIQEGTGTLLDHSMVLFGSGMGNANAHTNGNLPIILAGGGFRHGEHKAYPATGPGRQPLCNLYVSMLQRFGIETAKFGTSTGTLTGLA
ncbi:DUF1552 domain-containing protein [Horticoccus sp. 23ND18S-11]|uniref:DUF1552 domain-containing protein n=1 Tax=Horticoccus sp. 23ND18S-11 TaxID=3391832 RepID=UPI0039C98E32